MDKKFINNDVKKILKENSCIVIFSEGITILHGDADHCICSIAWSLNELRIRNNYIYTEIMKNLERLKNKDKESEE
jgi:hypothetical protein